MTAQNDNTQTIVVTAVESHTPLGLTASQTAAAIRAGISGFREHPPYTPIVREFDAGDDPIQVASHGRIDVFEWGRLYELIFQPLTTLVETSGLSRSAMKHGGLYFALPANDEVIQKCNLRRHFLNQVSEQLALPTTKDFLGVQTGSTGVYALVERAMEKLRSGELSFCIIAAVDCFFLDDRLDIYDQHWRLKTDRNPTGFIPGEAGAAFLLETEAMALQRNAPVLMRIDAVSAGQEPNPVTGSKTSSGAGLTDAIRSLSTTSGSGQPWQWVWSDLNGERYKAYEWGVALPRLNKFIANDHILSHIADSVGDVGAAMAAVQIGCISEAFKRGYAPSGSAMLFAGNDAGKRYAMAVSKG